MMLVEFTDSDGREVLVNPDKVLLVGEETSAQWAFMVLDGGNARVNVKQSFEEIKKRFGLAISPRAETIVKGV